MSNRGRKIRIGVWVLVVLVAIVYTLPLLFAAALIHAIGCAYFRGGQWIGAATERHELRQQAWREGGYLYFGKPPAEKPAPAAAAPIIATAGRSDNRPYHSTALDRWADHDGPSVAVEEPAAYRGNDGW